MQAATNGRALRDALTQVKTGVGRLRRNAPSIWESVIITADTDTRITFGATNGADTVTVESWCDVRVPGSICVPLAAMISAIKGVNGAITICESGITADGDTLLSFGQMIPPEDFPVPATPDFAFQHTMDGAKLREGLARVIPATSADTMRPILCAVHMVLADASQTLVGCDTDRLVVHEMLAPGIPKSEPQDSANMLVPRAAAEALAKLSKGSGATTCYPSQSHALFAGAGWSLLVRLTEGRYPDWRRVMPDTTKSAGRVTLDSAQTLAAIAAILPTAQRDKGRSRWTANCTGVDISACAEGSTVSRKIPAQMSGEFDCRLNAVLVADMLRPLGKSAATLHVGDSPYKPVAVTVPDDATYFGVLMPMQEGSNP